MPSRSRRGTTARVVTAVGVAVAVLVVAGGVTAYAATRQSAPTYRTATVGTQSVDQVLQETGTIEPSASAVVTFPVSGPVASVLVAMGDRVKAGQKMAALDTTSLRDNVASANASVANARLTLYQAQTGQTSTASTGSGSGSSTSNGSTANSSARSGSSAGRASGSTGSAKAVAAAQQRLLGTVRQVDAMLARAKADLATAAVLCASNGSPSPSPSPSASSSPSASPSPSPSGGGPGGGGGKPTTCAAAQQLVLADETQVQQIQQAVSKQESALDRLIAGSAGSGSGSTGSTASTGSTGSTATSSGAVSAAQLAADQAAVDAAVAQLALAEQNLAQATIVSPIDGVVSLVGLAVGAQASAGSSSSAIDVINPDGHGVTLSVDVTKIAEVKVGEKATVVPDGSTAALPATVSYVAVAPSSSGSSAYPVHLSFTGRPTGLRDGIQAAVSLVTAQTAGSLSVPTSAVYHLGSLAYVLLLDGSTTKRQIVTVGGVGAVYTQITKGLSAGQQVVLADVSAAIPTSTTSSRFARFAAGVGAGAGGLGGAGLTGGGAGAPRG
jgi:HlyD family secretion protein